MKGLLEGCKDTVFTESSVKILSAVTDENIRQIGELAGEILA